ncbi:MAG: dihydrolipoamide acetyltransferase family protein [Actinomycetota bacterium]|nr:dihydrolipoamide acetyltransferase family protein [Actinomycetota bacterium]MDA3013745.1 dihydrolipoamide acetyltransferase family protein [Actinomycetota bacterium]
MSQIVTMPQLGETVTEGTVLRWLVKVGDEVKEDDPILEISTDKVDTEVPSPFAGKVTNLLVEEGETVEVGVGLLELNGNAEKEENKNNEQSNIIPEPAQTEKVTVASDESQKKDIDAIKNNQNKNLSPIVRRLAGENNIDLTLVNGSGKHGRITRKDLEIYISQNKTDIEKNVTQNTNVEDKEVLHKSESRASKIDSGEITRLRKRIAQNMVLSKQISAHVMTSVEVDYESLEISRSKFKSKFKEDNGFSLTYLPFISLATISALKEFPTVNSSFDLEAGTHTLHKHVNLGIAVDLNQEGLLVGTIKDADSYNLKGIAKKISETSTLLRSGKFGLENVSGSTFTISNNGSFNSFITSPIINQPNVAILSTESVKKRAVVITNSDGSDSIAIRHTGVLSLTWDHRVFDGSIALLFLNFIKDKLEFTDWTQELS